GMQVIPYLQKVFLFAEKDNSDVDEFFPFYFGNYPYYGIFIQVHFGHFGLRLQKWMNSLFALVKIGHTLLSWLGDYLPHYPATAKCPGSGLRYFECAPRSGATYTFRPPLPIGRPGAGAHGP